MIGEITALGAALCWTLSAVLYKTALADAKPVSANISRCVSTTLFLILCLVVAGKLQSLTTLPAYQMFLAGLSGAVGLCLGDTMYMHSLSLIGVSKAVPITCTYPLFTMLFAALFSNEQITLFLLFGALLIVVGIQLISQEKNKSKNLRRSVIFRGVLVALVTAVVWGVSIALMNHALEFSELATLDVAFTINVVRMLATTILFLALSPFIDRKFRFIRLKMKTWMILALGGIVALGLGWTLLALSLLHIQASRAVPISSVSPLFATFLGAVFLKEKVTLRVFVGSVFIVLGTFTLFVV